MTQNRMETYNNQISKDIPEVITEGSNPYQDLKDGNIKVIKAKMNKVIDLMIDGKKVPKTDQEYFDFISGAIKDNK